MKSSFELIWKLFQARLCREKGATSIEYAILGALIAAVIALVVGSLGTQVRLMFASAKWW